MDDDNIHKLRSTKDKVTYRNINRMQEIFDKMFVQTGKYNDNPTYYPPPPLPCP